MGERKIARSAVEKFFDPGNIFAKRITVLYSHESDFLALRTDSFYIGGSERQLHLVGCDVAGEALHGIELFNGGFVSALISRRLERLGILRLSSLADIDAQKRPI